MWLRTSRGRGAIDQATVALCCFATVVQLVLTTLLLSRGLPLSCRLAVVVPFSHCHTTLLLSGHLASVSVWFSQHVMLIHCPALLRMLFALPRGLLACTACCLQTIYMCMCGCVYMLVHVYTYLCVYVCVCMCAYTYMYICVCLWVCVYVYIYIMLFASMFCLSAPHMIPRNKILLNT